MNYRKLNIPDLVLIEPQVFGDERGFFMETWRDDEFRQNVSDFTFVQDNHSKSRKGTLRGLHYQLKKPQGKIVRVISGEVFDVAVDLRRYSPTFGRWEGVTLTETNRSMFWVPPGFAHGFYVLSDEAEFVYKCTDYYSPDYERVIRWDDPRIAIDWPISSESSPILSPKDEGGLFLDAAEVYE